MKAAIRGTDHCRDNFNPRTVLHEAAVQGLQYMAGYVPAQMPIQSIDLPPVIAHDQRTSDDFMTSLCGYAVQQCNQRVPYMLLAWLLVGSDNPYRVKDYAAYDSLLRPVTQIALRCALGEQFTVKTLQPIIDQSWLIKEDREGDVWSIWADETISWVIWAIRSNGEQAVKAVEAAVWSATRIATIQASALIHKYAQTWCNIEDEEIWQIVQQLLLEVLRNGENE
jgi:hypothetical protein